MLNIGIIGCGQIAVNRHAPEYASNDSCRIVALYDPNQSRAAAIGERYGGDAYDSLEALLTSHIDAVSICTANSCHYSDTIKALNSGIHVLCEKPMAVTFEQCREMVEAADRNKKVLMLAHNQRYNISHQKAREMISSGEIGKVISFALTFGHSGPEKWTGQANPWFYDKVKSQFGAMADLGVHKLDLLRYLCGCNISTVTAKLGTLDKRYPDGSSIAVDDNAFFILSMENGAMGTVRASWTFYGDEDHSSIIYGTKGTIRLYDDPEYSIIVTDIGGKKKHINLSSMRTNFERTNGADDNSGVIDSFVASILNGTRSISDGHDALDSMRAVFAAQQSAQEDRTIKL